MVSNCIKKIYNDITVSISLEVILYLEKSNIYYDPENDLKILAETGIIDYMHKLHNMISDNSLRVNFTINILKYNNLIDADKSCNIYITVDSGKWLVVNTNIRLSSFVETYMPMIDKNMDKFRIYNSIWHRIQNILAYNTSPLNYIIVINGVYNIATLYHVIPHKKRLRAEELSIEGFEILLNYWKELDPSLIEPRNGSRTKSALKSCDI